MDQTNQTAVFNAHCRPRMPHLSTNQYSQLIVGLNLMSAGLKMKQLTIHQTTKFQLIIEF